MAGTILRVVLLTLLWAALQGSFDLGNFLFGGLISIVVIRLTDPVLESENVDEASRARRLPRPIPRLWWGLVLFLVFVRELIQSAAEVAWYTVQPTLQIRPGIVKYPLDVKTDREITMLANLISLTPGTLSLDVAPDRNHLYVHSISVETEDGRDVIHGIKASLEKYVSRALGPVA